nr:signal recognition particle receptor subunit alpha [Betaproteobacteria bacterium AqS2]
MISLAAGLAKLRAGLLPQRTAATAAEVLADLERRLLAADVGTAATRAVVARVKERAGGSEEMAAIGAAIRATLAELLAPLAPRPAPAPESGPRVVMLVGVNGGGKTTTVAKLARQEIEAGGQVVLAAADTFRAAAPEQLAELAGRLGPAARVVTDKDPGAAAYNAVAAGVAAGAGLVLIDTAGRQPNSKALMAEAAKIDKAAGKALAGAPHEKVLALDANTGQNALRQLELFDAELGLTGLVLTKLDGSSRGGVILAIAHGRQIP